MKLRISYLFLLFALLFGLFTNVIEVNAMKTGFLTEELSDEVKNTFLSNVNISPLTVEPVHRGILCFDVNKQGMIAVGQKGAYSKEICIYSADGTFLYGYSFDCSQSFAVEWGYDSINIFFVRSDIIVSLDSDGCILDIKKVPDTLENDTYRRDLLYSTIRTIGDTTYLIKNNLGIFNWIATSYSQIAIIDINGTEQIIYDVSPNQFSNIIIAIGIVCMFIFITIVVIGTKNRTGDGSLS